MTQKMGNGTGRNVNLLNKKASILEVQSSLMIWNQTIERIVRFESHHHLVSTTPFAKNDKLSSDPRRLIIPYTRAPGLLRI